MFPYVSLRFPTFPYVSLRFTRFHDDTIPVADVDEDRLLTEAELLAFLGISRTTVWRLRKHHGLPFGRVGREYRYQKSEILAWMKERASDDPQLRFSFRHS